MVGTSFKKKKCLPQLWTLPCKRCKIKQLVYFYTNSHWLPSASYYKGIGKYKWQGQFTQSTRIISVWHTIQSWVWWPIIHPDKLEKLSKITHTHTHKIFTTHSSKWFHTKVNPSPTHPLFFNSPNPSSPFASPFPTPPTKNNKQSHLCCF